MTPRPDSPPVMRGTSDPAGASRSAPDRPITLLLPPRRWSAGALLSLLDWRPVLVLCAAVLIAWRLFARAAPMPPGLFFYLLGLVILVALIQKARAARGARRLAGSNVSGPPGEPEAAVSRPALREVLALGPGRDRLLDEAADEERLFERLASTAFAGEAVWVTRRPRRLPGDFEPLAVPFEPMPLDAASARLLEPLKASTKPAARSRRVDLSDSGKRFRQLLIVLRRTGLLEGTGFIILVSLVFSLFMGGPLDRSFISRAAIVAAGVLLFLRRERVAGYLYLVPGGLIDARRRHVYRRRDGLMVWFADSRMLYVVDSGPSPTLSFTATLSEAKVAMRAWLSPLAEPSDELIRSFLGEADRP